MNLQPGIFLKSTAALDDTVFAGVTIFIAEYNAGGALGFVVNRRFGRSLNELQEFRHSPAFPLYDGGPVDKEHLFFLHRRPDLVEDGIAISDHVFYGGNFKQAVTGINNGSLSENDCKIFVGYCGWDAGELESELAEGSWKLSNDSLETIFA
jgi:putative transcriptional regulator